MGQITNRRGRLQRYAGPIDVSMLYQRVTLDEFLAMQYTPMLVQTFPEEATTRRERDRREISATVKAGDRLWLWRLSSRELTPPECESGGLAVVRGDKIIHAWVVWSAW